MEGDVKYGVPIAQALDRLFVNRLPDLAQQLAWLEQDRQLGFDAIYLHEVGRNQERFIETFGARVLPQLR